MARLGHHARLARLFVALLATSLFSATSVDAQESMAEAVRSVPITTALQRSDLRVTIPPEPAEATSLSLTVRVELEVFDDAQHVVPLFAADARVARATLDGAPSSFPPPRGERFGPVVQGRGAHVFEAELSVPLETPGATRARIPTTGSVVTGLELEVPGPNVRVYVDGERVLTFPDGAKWVGRVAAPRRHHHELQWNHDSDRLRTGRALASARHRSASAAAAAAEGARPSAFGVIGRDAVITELHLFSLVTPRGVLTRCRAAAQPGTLAIEAPAGAALWSASLGVGEAPHRTRRDLSAYRGSKAELMIIVPENGGELEMVFYQEGLVADGLQGQLLLQGPEFLHPVRTTTWEIRAPRRLVFHSFETEFDEQRPAPASKALICESSELTCDTAWNESERFVFRRAIQPAGHATELRISYADKRLATLVSAATFGLGVLLIFGLLALAASILLSDLRSIRRWIAWGCGVLSVGLAAALWFFPFALPPPFTTAAVALAFGAAGLLLRLGHWAWTVGYDLALDVLWGEEEEDDDNDLSD